MENNKINSRYFVVKKNKTLQMRSLHKYTCTSCSSSYSQFNLPYLLVNCDHFMCKRCVISVQECQQCGADVGIHQNHLTDYAVLSLDQLREREEERSRIQEQMRKFQDCIDRKDGKKNNTCEFKIQQCLLHSKPADLICIDDRSIICSSCALFGKHKGHQVMNRQGILTQFATYVEDCLKNYDDLKTANEKFSSSSYRTSCLLTIQQKKQNDRKKIAEKFQQLVSAIRIIQKKQLLRVNQHYKQKQKLLLQKQPKIQKLEVQIKKWCGQIQKIGALMQDTTNLQKIAECVPYIDTRNPIGDQIYRSGQALIKKLGQTQQQLQKQLQRQKQTAILQFDEEKVKSIEQYCIIKKNLKHLSVRHKKIESVLSTEQKQPKSPLISKNQNVRQFNSSMKKDRLKTESPYVHQKFHKISNFNDDDVHFIDDNLLLSVEPPQLDFNYQQNTPPPVVPKVHIAEELDADNLPYLSISDIRPITNTSSGQSSDQSRILRRENNRQLKQIANSGLVGLTVQIENQKKKKKVDFPQKFKGTVDDLKNDRAETIDLTGAQVGDGTILSLCPYIKKSKKLKTLKLIKNKLTDDCLPQLLESLAESKVCSLNLSQNLLSDKACFILNSCPLSQNLKTITLSLNKINRRNVKVKTDELAKKNITVLL